MKKCPHCGLINPDPTDLCDCGYNWQTGKKSEINPQTPCNTGAPAHRQAKPRTLLAVISALVLIALAALSFIYWRTSQLGAGYIEGKLRVVMILPDQLVDARGNVNVHLQR